MENLSMEKTGEKPTDALTRQHSIGPWSVDEYTLAILDAEGLSIGYAQHSLDHKQSSVDAALMARAPEMLLEIAALKQQLKETK
jgi:hypothetical protein